MKRLSFPATVSAQAETVRVHEAFASTFLGNIRTLTVHLPPGYSRDNATRYPVLYLHDGQNLFDPTRAAYGMVWRAGEIADRLTTEGRLRPILLVGIDNTPARLDEYGVHVDTGHHAGGKGDVYARFVVEEVKPFIDREYRTLSGRAYTGVAGSSMGGLVSLSIARTYHGDISRCGIVSPALWWARSALLSELEEGDTTWMRSMRFWVCMGTKEGRKRGHVSPHVERTRQLVNVMDRTGLLPGRDYYYSEIAGGEHNESAWADRFDKVLLYLFGW